MLVKSFMIISHLAVLSLSSVNVSALTIVSTSFARVRRSADMDKSSIKPNSDQSRVHRGWVGSIRKTLMSLADHPVGDLFWI